LPLTNCWWSLYN